MRKQEKKKKRQLWVAPIISLLAIPLLAFSPISIEVFQETVVLENDPYGEAATNEFIKTYESEWMAEGRGSKVSVRGSITLVGRIPRMYLGEPDLVGSAFGKVDIQDGLIVGIQSLSGAERTALLNARNPGVIFLSENPAGPLGDFDVIYPGLIDLHNHPKQNNLPTWGLARGQFHNRFEWSAWTEYKKAVSENVNPWINSHPAAVCSAFRWSELQAMILGTTYMQGHVSSSCVKDFAIHRVEDPGAYRYAIDADAEVGVSAPTFIVDPDAFEIVWNVFRPEMLRMAGIGEAAGASIDDKITNIERLIRTNVQYNDAVISVTKSICPALSASLSSGDPAQVLSVLINKEILKENCAESEISKQLINYLTRHHRTVVGKQEYLKHPRKSGIVAHVSEGRHDDAYNRIEFPLVQMMGMAKPGMNLVHAVGIRKSGYEHMANNQMGIVWSPYSNLLLYGETLNLDLIAEVNSGRRGNKLLMALGSDWVPTGSKSVLEEVKLARKYIRRANMGTRRDLTKVFSDKELFKMMTEYPARMIGHFHDGKTSEHGIGTLAVGAIGSIIVAKNQYKRNVFQNLVERTGEADINLVVVDGNVIYGETSYLNQAHFTPSDYEVLPKYFAGLASLRGDRTQAGAELTEYYTLYPEVADRVTSVGGYIARAKFANATDTNRCHFAGRKAFVHVERTHGVSAVADGVASFRGATGGRAGLDLNRVSDLQKLLGSLLMTQSRNAINGKFENMVHYFPSLYSCNDQNVEPHLDRINTFVSPMGVGDELSDNDAHEAYFYQLCGVCNSSGAQKMKADYGL